MIFWVKRYYGKLKKNKAYIFDVDGTLTPSRGQIDHEFKEFFNRFCLANDVYLVTGSDREKTIEQIGEDTYNLCKRVYNCSGNDAWEGSTNVYRHHWRLPQKPWKYLESCLGRSQFVPMTGWHFEERPGLLNFSIVGRRCTQEQREKYVKWDTMMSERKTIAEEFNECFSEDYQVKATVAGETGLDITPIGMGKAQILNDVVFTKYDHPIDEIWFFGDKTKKGGNDHDIATVMIANDNYVVPVNDWKDTYRILNQ